MTKGIITTVEGLERIVSGGGWVKERHIPTGSYVEVSDGLVDLEGITIKGMAICFNNCTLDGYSSCESRGGFKNCTVTIDKWSIASSVSFYNCITHIRNSTVSNVIVENGMLTLLENTSVDEGVLLPLKLQATQEQVVAIHKGHNTIGVSTVIVSATASCGSFGTYNGNVYYFAESDMVIAGCWQGKLENFKRKAEMRLVPKQEYEAVYNYFKAFK